MKRTDELAILSLENNSLNEEDTRVRSRGRTLKKSKEKERRRRRIRRGLFKSIREGIKKNPVADYPASYSSCSS